MTDIADLSEMKPRITVFGVGGAGGNAVNNMITAGLQGVDFVVANTEYRPVRSPFSLLLRFPILRFDADSDLA
jgi:cell division GTPase FtsZ